MRQVLGPGALGRPRGIGWRGRWEGELGWGIHVTPWLIHVNIWQNPLQCCEVISLQLIKINEKIYIYKAAQNIYEWMSEWAKIKCSPTKYFITLMPVSFKILITFPFNQSFSYTSFMVIKTVPNIKSRASWINKWNNVVPFFFIYRWNNLRFLDAKYLFQWYIVS